MELEDNITSAATSPGVLEALKIYIYRQRYKAAISFIPLSTHRYKADCGATQTYHNCGQIRAWLGCGIQIHNERLEKVKRPVERKVRKHKSGETRPCLRPAAELSQSTIIPMPLSSQPNVTEVKAI